MFTPIFTLPARLFLAVKLFIVTIYIQDNGREDLKYWIFPSFIEFSGLGMAAVFAYLMIYVQGLGYSKEVTMLFVVGLGGCSLGFLSAFGHIAVGERLRHHKRILQKHGLWQDEEIKKKDLPKQEKK